MHSSNHWKHYMVTYKKKKHIVQILCLIQVLLLIVPASGASFVAGECESVYLPMLLLVSDSSSLNSASVVVKYISYEWYSVFI